MHALFPVNKPLVVLIYLYEGDDGGIMTTSHILLIGHLTGNASVHHVDTIEITQQLMEEWLMWGLGTSATLLGNVYCLDIRYT